MYNLYWVKFLKWNPGRLDTKPIHVHVCTMAGAWSTVLNIIEWVAYTAIVTVGVLMVTIWKESLLVGGVILLTLFVGPLVIGLFLGCFVLIAVQVIGPTQKGLEDETGLKSLMMVDCIK